MLNSGVWPTSAKEHFSRHAVSRSIAKQIEQILSGSREEEGRGMQRSTNAPQDECYALQCITRQVIKSSRQKDQKPSILRNCRTREVYPGPDICVTARGSGTQTNHISYSDEGCSCKATLTRNLTISMHSRSVVHQLRAEAFPQGGEPSASRMGDQRTL